MRTDAAELSMGDFGSVIAAGYEAIGERKNVLAALDATGYAPFSIAAVLDHPKVWEDLEGGDEEILLCKLFNEHLTALIAGLEKGINVSPFILGSLQPRSRGSGSGTRPVDTMYDKCQRIRKSTGALYGVGLPGRSPQTSESLIARGDMAADKAETAERSAAGKARKARETRAKCDQLRLQLRAAAGGGGSKDGGGKKDGKKDGKKGGGGQKDDQDEEDDEDDSSEAEDSNDEDDDEDSVIAMAYAELNMT